MEFKYSISIFFSHMGYIFKIFLWWIISLLVTVAVGAAIFVPLYYISDATTQANVYLVQFVEILRATFIGDVSMRKAAQCSLPIIISLVKALGDNVAVATGVVFGGIFVYMVYSFMIGISQYSISHIINNIMNSNLRLGFASSLILHLRKSTMYSLARVFVCLPIDLLIAAVFLALLLGVSSLIGFFVLPIILLFLIASVSLRATALAGWLPRMLYHPDEKVYTSLTRSFTYVKHNFKGLVKAFVLIYTIIFMLLIAFALPTGGLITVILPSIYYFVLRAVELVGHYKTHGNSFYTDGNTVINTVEYGYRKANQNYVGDSFNED